MKNSLLFLIITVALLSSCKHQIDAYDGESGIYFDHNEILEDTVYVAWGLKPGNVVEQRIKLRVNLLGDVVDYDRPFQIEIAAPHPDSLTAHEGQEYKKIITDYQLKANQAYTNIEIDLIRSQVLLDSVKCLTIKLLTNDKLQYVYSRQVKDLEGNTRFLDMQRVIHMSEKFPKPKWWESFGVPIFGKWSMKKSIVICDLLNIDREKWIGDLVPPITIGYLKYVGKYVHNWLQDNPTMDGDELMQMGPESQR